MASCSRRQDQCRVQWCGSSRPVAARTAQPKGDRTVIAMEVSGSKWGHSSHEKGSGGVP